MKQCQRFIFTDQEAEKKCNILVVLGEHKNYSGATLKTKYGSAVEAT